MKKKTINSIIKKKITNWLDSIEDKELANKIKYDIIVTGGCITSMLLNEEVNDFDVYFKTKESLKAISEYYCKKFNENNSRIAKVEEDPDLGRIKIMIQSAGIAEDSDAVADKAEYSVEEYLKAVNDADEIPAEKIEDSKYKPVFLSTNAITLSGKIQIVVRFYGEPDKIHENYDFVHATNYWTMNTGTVLNQPALEATINRELHYVGSKYPICSLVRTRKFIKRGWQINAGQYVKMAFQISELNLKDPLVFEDQLVGVDSVYFLSFIAALKDKIDKDPNFVLDQQYLTTVIDKIFG